jgi:hypothetical protein
VDGVVCRVSWCDISWILQTQLLTLFFLLVSAYTMFNVFLPKLLETSSGSRDGVETPKKLENTLWDVVIFTLGGCPGPIVSFLSASNNKCLIKFPF